MAPSKSKIEFCKIVNGKTVGVGMIPEIFKNVTIEISNRNKLYTRVKELSYTTLCYQISVLCK